MPRRRWLVKAACALSNGRSAGTISERKRKARAAANLDLVRSRLSRAAGHGSTG
jgi:hypothetical protein